MLYAYALHTMAWTGIDAHEEMHPAWRLDELQLTRTFIKLEIEAGAIHHLAHSSQIAGVCNYQGFNLPSKTSKPIHSKYKIFNM